jgi:RimJ/RimL family protein N-acetyltransferase
MNAPLITTPRLDLWKAQASDLPELAALTAPAAVRRFLGNRPPSLANSFTRLLRSAGSWALYGYGDFVVRERGASDVVGTCGAFHSWRGFDGFDDVPEVGWIFAEPVWGRGYATEAAGAALAWFDRDHGPRRIACMIEPDNHASFAVAAKLGFTVYGEQDFEGGPVILLQRVAGG